MNAKKVFWYLPVLVLAAVVTFTACKKDEPNYTNVPTDQENKDYGMESARLEKIFIDVDNMSDQAYALRNNPLLSIALGSECAKITVDTGAKKITVSFGTSNCLCKDGRYRRGSVLINYTGSYSDSGSYHVTTFKDYYVNNYKVEGTRTTANKGRNAQKLAYSTVDMSGSVTSPDGKAVASCTANYVRMWTEGEWTPTFIDDDQYSISGTGVFTASTGLKYNIKTDQSMIVYVRCGWVGMGIVELIPIGGIARILNYGAGECDDKAVITVNNVQSTLKMD